MQAIGEDRRRSGHPARSNPTGQANLPRCSVSRLVRCTRINLRRLPCLWANSYWRRHDPGEKLGLTHPCIRFDEGGMARHSPFFFACNEPILMLSFVEA
jgi:hypothetical protein